MSGRGGKGKTTHYPADLFALGPTKGQSRVDPSEAKRAPQTHSKPVPSHGVPGKHKPLTIMRAKVIMRVDVMIIFPASGSSERKREAPSSGMSSMMLPKKPKLSPSVGAIHSRGVAGPAPTVSAPPITGADFWETVAVEIEPSEFVAEVLKANDAGQTDKVVCMALETCLKVFFKN